MEIHHEGIVEDSETIISWKLSKVLSKVRHKDVHEEKSNIFIFSVYLLHQGNLESVSLTNTHTTKNT